MKFFTFTLIIVFLLVWSFFAKCQTLELSLSGALELAQKQSLEYKIASNVVKSSYWNFRAHKAGFYPKLSFNGTIPEYFHSINRITLPNGQYDFVRQDVGTSSLGLDLSQNVGLTGGKISMSSSLDRIDNFGNQNRTVYTTIPLSFNYYQNSLFYNEFKWQKKIEPLRFEEAKRDYVEKLEDIAYNTIDKYFDVLQSQSQLKLDQQNLKNIDTLIKITNARFEIGTVQLNDVLQAKVSRMNAQKSASTSLLSLEVAKQALVRYLNLEKYEDPHLLLPEHMTDFEVSEDIALTQARTNRRSIVEFQRRKMEAEQSVARTRAATGPVINFRTNVGFSQKGRTINEAYNNLLNNRTIVLGVSVPLIDWGVNRSNRKRSEANLDLEINSISQQMLSIEQEIMFQVMRWKMLKEQSLIGKATSELTQQRYNIAKQKYLLGSISFTDFNYAQLEKDRAVMDYIDILRNYWSMKYLIRKLTHFDFEKNRTIELVDVIER